jgi:hypothetical protein
MSGRQSSGTCRPASCSDRSMCLYRSLLWKANGALESTDGQWYWPDGLSRYGTAHNVRLPQVCRLRDVMPRVLTPHRSGGVSSSS